MKKKLKAFTLIELLVVVAVIGVLASIEVPNFMDALVKCRVAKVKSDLKALSHSIELYRLDYQTVLPVVGAFDPSYFERLRPLTTPVAYMSQLPTDPFQPMLSFFMFTEDEAHYWQNQMYVYNRGDVENGSTKTDEKGHLEFPFSLASTGPDHRLKYPYYFHPKGFIMPEWYVYNPSNGISSGGDIFYRSTTGLDS